MRAYSLEEIRQCFSKSTDFNEIFDAFQSALSQKITDLEQYRLLFWNHSLSTDEIRFFGKKLSEEFPEVAYDVYLWLASVFEVTCSSDDNYELALHYYQKASQANPKSPDPYLDVCDCYDPDLNIPPVANLIEFVKTGLTHVANPVPLYRRLVRLYDHAGNPEQSDLYRKKAEEGGSEPPASGAE